MQSLNPNLRCDVLVLGGGPAGAMSALLAARAGFSTILLDRAAFPRDKVCGGTLSGAAITALEATGADVVLRDAGSIALREFELLARGEKLRLASTRHRVIARRDFDAALLTLAERAGARVWTECSGAVVENSAHRAIVSATTSRSKIAIEARAVIAADGLGSRALGTANIAKRSRIGAGAVIRGEPGPPRGVLRMAIGRRGYVGVVRLPSGDLDVAAALDPEFARDRSLGGACDAILEEAGAPPMKLRDQAFRGTPELTRSPACAARQRVFAVGDAAGYVEPFSGEGIGWALSSALTLAPLLTRAVAGDARVAADYEARLGVAVRGRQRLCRALAWTLRRPAGVALAFHALRLAPSLGSRLIDRLDRAPELAGVLR